MPNLIVTADWHINESNRLKDFEVTLEEIVKYAAFNKVEYFVIVGDLYAVSEPSNKERTIVHRLISRLGAFGCKVIIIPGNHDISNNDLEADHTAVSEFVDLKLDNVSVIHRGKLELSKDINLCFLSHLTKKDIGDKTYLQAYSEYLTELVEPKKKNILFSHVLVEGITESSDTTRSVNVAVFNRPGISQVYLGDIHKPCQISQAPEVYYCGSPERISFNEIGDQKRFLHVTVSDSEVHTVSKSLDTRRFVKMEFDLSNKPKLSISTTQQNTETFDEPMSTVTICDVLSDNKTLLQDAFVHVHIRGNEDFLKVLDRGAIKECLKALKPFKADINFMVTDAVAVRDKSFTTEINPEQLLLKWVGLRQIPEEIKAAVIAEGSTMLKETGHGINQA